MEGTEQNGHGQTRMDRLEHLKDLLITDHLTFSDEQKKLLTAQVLLTDRLEQLAVSAKELRDAQKDTRERISALIGTVDALVRHRPN
jgi:hypothetical protein